MNRSIYYCDFTFSSLITPVEENTSIFVGGYAWGEKKNKGPIKRQGDGQEFVERGSNLIITLYDTSGSLSIVSSLTSVTLDFDRSNSPFEGHTLESSFSIDLVPTGSRASFPCNVTGMA